MLMYRTCRCCRRIWSKLLHTMFHLLAAPCIAIGFVAVWDFHNDRRVDGVPAPVPHFYSLHSWMGLTTMGLFALQVWQWYRKPANRYFWGEWCSKWAFNGRFFLQGGRVCLMGENDILTFLWFGQITGFEWLRLRIVFRSLGAFEWEWSDMWCWLTKETDLHWKYLDAHFFYKVDLGLFDTIWHFANFHMLCGEKTH